MSITFDEVVLDDAYSGLADGGPEFSTAIIRSGPGGGISSRAETREDYTSKYEIDYGELTVARRDTIRQFAILRKGMARGFRFTAPDGHTLTSELVGKQVTGTNDVIVASTANGVLTTFYLIKTFTDAGNTYYRRIVKPSPYLAVTIAFSTGQTTTIAAISSASAVPTTSTGTINAINFTFYWRTGIIVFASAPANGTAVRVSCDYHLPVAFSDDWLKFSVDEVAISSFKIGVEELLPIELGITI
ncbi:hypothetical protein BH10ACI2_BH10ACI2_04390 [soil metagenome]